MICKFLPLVKKAIHPALFFVLAYVVPIASTTEAAPLRLLGTTHEERQAVLYPPDYQLPAITKALGEPPQPELEVVVRAFETNADPQVVLDQLLLVGDQFYNWNVVSYLLVFARNVDRQIPPEEQGHVFAVEKAAVLKMNHPEITPKQRLFLLRTARTAAQLRGMVNQRALARAHRYQREILEAGGKATSIPPVADDELNREVASKQLIDLLLTDDSIREESLRYLAWQGPRNGIASAELPSRRALLIHHQDWFAKVGVPDTLQLLLAKQVARDVEYGQILETIEPDELIAEDNMLIVLGGVIDSAEAKVAYWSQVLRRFEEVKKAHPDWVREHLGDFYVLHGLVVWNLLEHTKDCQYFRLYESLKQSFIESGGDPSLLDMKTAPADC